MEPMTIFFLVAGALAFVSIIVLLKVRTMENYKIVKEQDSNGKERFFPKIRKGLSYYYLVQTHDAPGYENDIFEKKSEQVGGQETENLAKSVVYNHKMTVITGREDDE